MLQTPRYSQAPISSYSNSKVRVPQVKVGREIWIQTNKKEEKYGFKQIMPRGYKVS